MFRQKVKTTIGLRNGGSVSCIGELGICVATLEKWGKGEMDGTLNQSLWPWLFNDFSSYRWLLSLHCLLFTAQAFTLGCLSKFSSTILLASAILGNHSFKLSLNTNLD